MAAAIVTVKNSIIFCLIKNWLKYINTVTKMGGACLACFISIYSLSLLKFNPNKRLPNYRISSLSLMELGNLFGAKPENRISAAQLKGVRQPVMLIWGSNDPFGSVKTGLGISKILPSAAFHVVENGGHLPWLDDPAGCGRLTLDFLAGYESHRLWQFPARRIKEHLFVFYYRIRRICTRRKLSNNFGCALRGT